MASINLLLNSDNTNAKPEIQLNSDALMLNNFIQLFANSNVNLIDVYVDWHFISCSFNIKF